MEDPLEVLYGKRVWAHGGQGVDHSGQVSWPGLPWPVLKNPPCPLNKTEPLAFTSQEFEPRDTDFVTGGWHVVRLVPGPGKVSSLAGGWGKEEGMRTPAGSSAPFPPLAPTIVVAFSWWLFSSHQLPLLASGEGFCGQWLALGQIPGQLNLPSFVHLVHQRHFQKHLKLLVTG